eukprot:TRINITY_DN3972_c0_g1_i1.p1 TRINITY_DN3972_c0_g1~~TRINITY_DN3972_c0_g1_i1.p1  ORF type:complete len:296 (+),score=68.60 TRINITY_DN3972_c0_g1_i1:80-967(+)
MNFRNGMGSPGFGGSQFGDGGGFVRSPTAKSSIDAGGSPSGKYKSNRTSSVLPVTIKQILSAQASPNDDNVYRIDGKEFAFATFIGMIFSVVEGDSYCMYTVDDGTGQIDVRLWSTGANSEQDFSANQAKRSQLREGIYVRVFATVRLYQNKPMLNAQEIQPLVDFNELTYHYLEAIKYHLLNTRGAAQGSAPLHPGHAGGWNPHAGSGSMADGGQWAQNQGNYGGNFSQLQQQVLAVFERDTESEQGISIDTVCNQLPRFPRSEIEKTVRWLSEEGHLFPTIDDFHFKRIDIPQ